MASSSASEVDADLGRFAQEQAQCVHDFCAYLLPDESAVEEIMVAVFRGFIQRHHRLTQSTEFEPRDRRVVLFQVAWSQVQQHIQAVPLPGYGGGRDTRILMGMDEDLLKEGRAASLDAGRLRARLARVDADLRAPVVLRDILGFTDEESARVLGLRWGVYRHRLHRGRLDFKDALKGGSGFSPARGPGLEA